MKKITLLLALSLPCFLVFGQATQMLIDQNKWDDPMIFSSNPPLINGYGEYSDSLAKAYEGYKFYECNDEYYGIATLADYYYWFVNEYYWKFNQPEIYEYYYITGNNLEMMKYIYSDNYTGDYYPVNITVEDEGLQEYINNRIKEDRYYADNDKKIKDFKQDLSTIEDSDNSKSSRKSKSLTRENDISSIKSNYHNIPVIKREPAKSTGSKSAKSNGSAKRPVKK